MNLDQLEEVYKKIQEQIKIDPKNQDNTIGIILGSGWGLFVESLTVINNISYSKIPHIPMPGVIGHKGELVHARSGNKDLIIFQGRFHPYENYDSILLTTPIHILNKLGIKKVIITNASGGINNQFIPGDIVAISDHINLMGKNPLIGPHNTNWGERFPNMNECYSKNFRSIYRKCCEQLNIIPQEGIYAGMLGPSYETPAEIRMLRILGADLVGMSTIPEVIMSNALGIQTLALSCISNKAAALNGEVLDHNHVKIQVEKSMKIFMNLLLEIIKKI